MPANFFDAFIADEIIWRPLVAPATIGVTALALSVMALLAYHRVSGKSFGVRAALCSLRLAAVAFLTLVLCGPSQTIPPPQQDAPPRWTWLVDGSPSMQTTDVAAASRWSAIHQHWLAETPWTQWTSQNQIESWLVGESMRPLDSVDRKATLPEDLQDDTGTNLHEAVREVLQSTFFSAASGHHGILVLSDGHDTSETDVRELISLAQARHAPIHAAVVGGSSAREDLVISVLPLQEYLFPNEPGTLLVRIYQNGLKNTRTTLRVRQGVQEQQFSLQLGDEPTYQQEVEIRAAEPGPITLDVSVDAVANERETNNNRQQVFSEVQPRRIRVLILEGAPFWDTKFMAQSLRKDDRLELTQISQVADESREVVVSRTNEATGRVPQTRAEWAPYDVIILGRGLERLLTPESAAGLRDYVLEGGGQVVWARGRWDGYGPSADAELQVHLAPLIPVRWNDDSPSPLEHASLAFDPLAVEGTWLAPEKWTSRDFDSRAELPAWSNLDRVASMKPAARVVATAFDATDGTRHPAIVTMPAGRGRVVALLGEGSWKWSLLPRERQELSGLYDQFWSNLARWMVLGSDFPPGERVTLRLASHEARRNSPVAADIAFRDEDAASSNWSLTWTGPDGRAQVVPTLRLPGRDPRFRATINAQAWGVHRLRLDAADILASPIERSFYLAELDQEQIDVSARADQLRQLAEQTGGVFFDATDPKPLLAWDQQRRLAKNGPTEVHYVWHRSEIMSLILFWLGIEWIMRRLLGLL